MRKTIPVLLLIFLIGATYAAAYTVVLKNGKLMTGTLVSETDQMILFKDDAGVQYSLKKNGLDLTKMSEANAPKIEAVPTPPARAPEPEVKKKSRVYTKEDVDTLRTKYPELSIGKPIENAEDFEGGVLKPEAYLNRINEGGARVGESVTGLVRLRDAVATAWEVAASTGKDPQEAVTAALSTEEASLILRETSEDLAAMGQWQESMSNPPDQYKDGYNLFVQSMTDLSDFNRALREWKSFENVNLFRSRLGDLENRLNSGINRLRAWKPVEPPAPAATTPPEEEEEEEAEEEPPAQ